MQSGSRQDLRQLQVIPKKRADGRYALRLILDQGELPEKTLRGLLGVVTEYGADVRVTVGQRINIEGLDEQSLPEVAARLDARIVERAFSVTVCPGGGICRMGRQPTRDLARAVLDAVNRMGPFPGTVKSGVSGCAMGCALSFARDVGLVAGAGGWTLYLGNLTARRMQRGITLGTDLSEARALDLLEKGLGFYRAHARKRERPGDLVHRLGAEAVLRALGL